MTWEKWAPPPTVSLLVSASKWTELKLPRSISMPFWIPASVVDAPWPPPVARKGMSCLVAHWTCSLVGKVV
jgi:hypothetical protein